MSKVYVVFPPTGWGSNDMVIVADNEDEAASMYYEEARMVGEYYEEARRQGCKVILIDKSKGVKYTRQDNM